MIIALEKQNQHCSLRGLIVYESWGCKIKYQGTSNEENFFELILEQDEGMSHLNIGGKDFPRWGNSKYKGPKWLYAELPSSVALLLGASKLLVILPCRPFAFWHIMYFMLFIQNVYFPFNIIFSWLGFCLHLNTVKLS